MKSLAKKIVRKTSTRRRLRFAMRALSDFWEDLVNEARHGRDLAEYCHGKTGLLLHIGCGELVEPGWINIDAAPRSGVFYCNMMNALPLKNGTVHLIHMEHFLEHLEYDDAVNILGECYRILEIGGTLRVVVPDLEIYAKAYVENDYSFFERLRNLGRSSDPLPTKAAVCNQMLRMGGDHRFAWDFDTLEYVTRRIGFSSIIRSHKRDHSVPNCIDAQDWWRPVESLYANVTR